MEKYEASLLEDGIGRGEVLQEIAWSPGEFASVMSLYGIVRILPFVEEMRDTFCKIAAGHPDNSVKVLLASKQLGTLLKIETTRFYDKDSRVREIENIADDIADMLNDPLKIMDAIDRQRPTS
jgi:hypothetical protein